MNRSSTIFLISLELFPIFIIIFLNFKESRYRRFLKLIFKYDGSRKMAKKIAKKAIHTRIPIYSCMKCDCCTSATQCSLNSHLIKIKGKKFFDFNELNYLIRTAQVEVKKYYEEKERAKLYEGVQYLRDKK